MTDRKLGSLQLKVLNVLRITRNRYSTKDLTREVGSWRGAVRNALIVLEQKGLVESEMQIRAFPRRKYKLWRAVLSDR